MTASYSFSTGQADFDCSRDGELSPDYALKVDSLSARVNGVPQTAKFTADPKNSKFEYSVNAGGQQVENSFDLHPRTVILNNFDPSGVQELVYLAAIQPASARDYWALLAQGRGVEVAMTLEPAPGGEGTLDGAELTLKHWTLTIGPTVMQIWSDQNNGLMEAAIPSQTVVYTRDGFALEAGLQSNSISLPPAAALAPNEHAISFVSDGVTFPAILTLPKNREGPVSIVVLVQGSGPQDEDETIGPNKPFRDIAEGLSAYGIATLRYDKRTHFAPRSFLAHPDLEHETILDAVAALGYAASLPDVDGHRVFLLGHSLGGLAAPAIVADRLQQKPGSVRGIIFLAAPATSMESTIERQFAASAERSGESAAQISALRTRWEKIFTQINNPLTPATESLGVPPVVAPESYWRSLLKQDSAAELKQLEIPALVLRGTKDIQVSEEDFDALAKANTAPGSESKEIAGLNHLFMPVAGNSTGAEYFTASHVDPRVIRIIADWITQFK